MQAVSIEAAYTEIWPHSFRKAAYSQMYTHDTYCSAIQLFLDIFYSHCNAKNCRYPAPLFDKKNKNTLDHIRNDTYALSRPLSPLRNRMVSTLER